MPRRSSNQRIRDPISFKDFPGKAERYNALRLSTLASDLAALLTRCDNPQMTEIIFEVREDETDGGFVATALGYDIATQGDTMEEIREMVRDAVRCHFGDGAPGQMPKIIRLHFVRDEAFAV